MSPSEAVITRYLLGLGHETVHYLALRQGEAFMPGPEAGGPIAGP